MSSRLPRLFSAVLTLTIAVACAAHQPVEKTRQVSTALPESNAQSKAKQKAKDTPAASPDSKKNRRPLQPWARYWLTE